MNETAPTKEAPAIDLDVNLEPDPVQAPATIDSEQRRDRAVPSSAVVGTQEVSPLDKIAELIERGIDADKIDRYLDLQERWEKEQARRAYHRAMAAFKREPIAQIIKNKRVTYNTKDRNSGQITGTVDYSHEELYQVVEAVLGPMAKHGLTHKWVPEQENGIVKVTCVVTHELGYSDSVMLYAAPDESGRKNQIQQVKSAISYLERITLLAIAGLAARGMDDDGQASGVPRTEEERAPSGKPQTEAPRARSAGSAGSNRSGSGQCTGKQVGLIERRLGESGVSASAFCDHFELTEIAELPKSRVDDALAWIKKQAG